LRLWRPANRVFFAHDPKKSATFWDRAFALPVLTYSSTLRAGSREITIFVASLQKSQPVDALCQFKD